MKTIGIDIMQRDGVHHYKALRYPFTPPISLKDVFLWILQQLPSLQHRDFVAYIDDLRWEFKHNKPELYETV